MKKELSPGVIAEPCILLRWYIAFVLCPPGVYLLSSASLDYTERKINNSKWLQDNKDTLCLSIFNFSSLLIDLRGSFAFPSVPASEHQYRSSEKHLLRRFGLQRCWWHCSRNGLKVTLKCYSDVSWVGNDFANCMYSIFSVSLFFYK